MFARLMLVVSLAMVLTTVACKSGGDAGKCDAAMAKSIGFATQMAETMLAGAGDKAEEMKADMHKKMAEKQPEAIAKCKEAYAKDPAKVGPALDCITAAADLQAASACPKLDIQ